MNNYRTVDAALARLDPCRITAGRELRGLTKKALADKIGKTPSAVSQFESGRCGMDVETFAAIAMALGLPPSYFAEVEHRLEVDFSTCHFRANKSVPQAERRKAVQHAIAVVEIFRALERRGITFPDANVPIYSWEGYSPAGIEKLAVDIRRTWGMGDGPILDMAALLETQGIVVVLLPEECAKLDAFSFWAEDRPVVVVSASVAASRLQFDYGHELAHLILHMDESAGDPESERAANHFAGAFLAPQQAFRLECPKSWYYARFLALKNRWRMSMQAALFRGRQLGIISEQKYRWGMVDLSDRNQRIKEEGEFERPLPSLLRRALEALQGEVTLDELAGEVQLAPREVEALLHSQLLPPELIAQLKPAEPVRVTPNVVYLKGKN